MHEIVPEHSSSDSIDITISPTHPQCITAMFDTDTDKTYVNPECASIKVTSE